MENKVGEKMFKKFSFFLILGLSFNLGGIAFAEDEEKDKKKSSGHHSSALSDHGVDPEKIGTTLPERTSPLIDLGPGFLREGDVGDTLVLPGGLQLNPDLDIFGNAALEAFYQKTKEGERSGVRGTFEWNTRLKLNQASDRFVFGMNNLRDASGDSVEYLFSPRNERGFHDEGLNAEVNRIFFEGNLRSTFPGLADNPDMNIGYFVGIKPVEAQRGALINDDSMGIVGVERNNLAFGPITRAKITTFVGGYRINRGDGVRDDNSVMVGLLTEADTLDTLFSFDAVYVDGDEVSGDGLFLGASATDTTFLDTDLSATLRLLVSMALKEETEATRDGFLVIGEISKMLPGSEDIVYWNTFFGVDQYTPAADSPRGRGILNSMGYLFSPMAPGLESGLSRDVDRSIGTVIGFQKVLKDWNVITEIGARHTFDREGVGDQIAIGIRIQKALQNRRNQRHAFFEWGGFVRGENDEKPAVGTIFRFVVLY